MKYLLLQGIILLMIFGCRINDHTDEDLTVADAEHIAISPDSHPLNSDIFLRKKDPLSDAIIEFLSEGNFGIKADFGSGLYNGASIGIPFVVVCKNQPMVNITFQGDNYDGNYGNESDPGPYPIPLNAPVEGNGSGDSHVIAIDNDSKKLYELYNANVMGNGWQASAGAIFDLTKTEYRTLGWTSADAAGLPIFPCLVRYDEVESGMIDHAIRFTLPKAKVMKGFIAPARHLVNGGNINPDVPTPFGMRLRLKTDFNTDPYSTINKVIFEAMKGYGIILADIGSSFFISGAPNVRWDNEDLRLLLNVKPINFEVIEMGQITKE